MDPLVRKGRLEKDEEKLLRAHMNKLGWHVEKTHGSLYQQGWPDLYAMHLAHGQRWIEMKRKGTGALENSQAKKFSIWRKFGLGVWILTGPEDYSLLFKAPNWHIYLDAQLRRLYGSRHLQ